MVHSLVNISGCSLMSDVADDNLLPLEDRYWEEDRKRFYHKSFIEYLLDPPYSLQYSVDMEEMNTRLMSF